MYVLPVILVETTMLCSKALSLKRQCYVAKRYPANDNAL